MKFPIVARLFNVVLRIKELFSFQAVFAKIFVSLKNLND